MVHSRHVKGLKMTTLELDSEAEDEKDTFWEKNGPFWRTYREILEIDCVSDSAAPPKCKTMPEMKYLDTKASQEFFDFFSKNIFSQYFPKFSTPQNPKFRDLTDPAICMDTLRIGHITRPARSRNFGF